MINNGITLFIPRRVSFEQAGFNDGFSIVAPGIRSTLLGGVKAATL
jgi:hypothetical protein